MVGNQQIDFTKADIRNGIIKICGDKGERVMREWLADDNWKENETRYQYDCRVIKERRARSKRNTK